MHPDKLSDVAQLCLQHLTKSIDPGVNAQGWQSANSRVWTRPTDFHNL